MGDKVSILTTLFSGFKLAHKNLLHLDLYGCSLWNFGSNDVETFYTAWIYLLHGINNTLPINVMLEQRCFKFIWTLLHSPNIIVKSVMRSAIRNGYSTLGEHFRYLSYKYNLSPTL